MNVRTFGSRLTQQGAVFRLWAPTAETVDLLIGHAYPMQRHDDGWFTIEVKGISADTQYRFRINDEINIPDPVSCFQPDDVLGPSQLLAANSYHWNASDWKGRPWEEVVIVEAHVGTFTSEGTYTAMIERLDHLVETGFTAIELMPLAEFPGQRNWGYDGVLWYAPDATYGTPDELKRLIDEAHKRGLMVFLDVVYNHFGPEGNFLNVYWPGFFKPDTATPWGAAINFKDAHVRDFIIENAMYWLRNYRFDGLRLDAIHAIIEKGDTTILNSLSEQVGRFAAHNGRYIHLMVENDDNTASLLEPRTIVPDGSYRAQWNDDYHHAMHVILTGEGNGYYQDFANKPLDYIVRTLASGFAYQGEPSRHRRHLPRGEPSGRLPPTAFIHFIQNHDQIGNRARGERLTTLCAPPAIEAALALTLLSPQIPLMFMGDEWGCTQPFPFFCDFAGDLANAVREGRRHEFAAHFYDARSDIPDPMDARTFRSAVLDWSSAARPESVRRHQIVKALLACRREYIVPRLRGTTFGDAAIYDTQGIICTFRMYGDVTLRILSNLSDRHLHAYTPPASTKPIWNGATTDGLEPWSTHAWLETT